MALNRRDLLKKGAAAGVITAGAAALNLATAPAAQATGANMQRLYDWRNKWGPGIFTWSYAAPRHHHDLTYETTYWSRSSSYRASYEGDSVSWKYWYEKGGELLYTVFTNPFWSLNHMNWELDSVVVIQVMLNALVEQGYLGGSTIAADGSFGNITHYKVGDFQIAAGLTVDGVVGPTTLNAMRARLGL